VLTKGIDEYVKKSIKKYLSKDNSTAKKEKVKQFPMTLDAAQTPLFKGSYAEDRDQHAQDSLRLP
jgi:hypothetical protein